MPSKNSKPKRSKKIRSICCFIVSLALVNCTKNPKEHLKLINGYWEIYEVTLKNGNSKQYQFNETVDFIKVSDSFKGFRKKLKPSINGYYKTSNAVEHISLKIKNDQITVYYKTKYASWTETITKLTKTQLHLKNNEGVTYKYKPYRPIELSVE